MAVALPLIAWIAAGPVALAQIWPPGDTGGTGDTGPAGDTGSGDGQPVALAGQPFLGYPGDTLILDGTASYDPDGDAIRFTWTQVGGPEVKIARGDTANPEFIAQDPGTHSFELVVSDGHLDSEPDVVDVVIVDATGGLAAPPAKKGCQSAPASGVFGLLGLLPLLLRRRRLI